jgi:LysM repeat protein
MTRKQVAFIIGLNAVISAVISVVVVLIFAPPGQEAPAGATTMPTSSVMNTQTVGEEVMPTVEVVLHVVKAGDTISGMAFQYDVPEEDIIAANQLENPNFLQVGVQLIIPIGGVPQQATATFTPAPTATNTPLPFDPPSADMTATVAAELGATTTPLPTPLPSSGELTVEITEVLGAGQVDQERVVITNLGETLASMQDWTLSGADGNVYAFPNFRLWGGGGVTVHTRVGQDGNPPANFYWGKLEPVWSLGDVVTLKDAQGAVLATYTVGR